MALAAVDQGTGVQSIRYGIDGEVLQPYNEPFGFAESGIHQLEYSASDHVNNTEAMRAVPIFVDVDVPQIEISYSLEPLSDPGQGVVRILAETILYIEAMDRHTEVDKITYRFDGGEEKLYRNPLSGFKAGRSVKLKVFATDRLNNVAELSVTLQVETPSEP